MNEEQQDKELHPDWKGEPVMFAFQRIPPRRSRFLAYIIGNARDGKRYCRTVGASVVDDAANERLKDTFHRVIRSGPSACRAFLRDGDLPGEADMPEWNDEPL